MFPIMVALYILPLPSRDKGRIYVLHIGKFQTTFLMYTFFDET